jgi:Na+-translocating ferredoxin:NAD+ oxidoreductase RnfG subunit
MKQRSTFTLMMITIVSFVVLMLTHAVASPILLNRKNAEFLSLLRMTSVGSYTVNEPQVTSASLKEDGIVGYQTITDGSQLYGIVYEVITSGYNNDLSFYIAIKEETFQSFTLIRSNETPSFGGVLLTNLTDLLPGLSVDGNWLATILGASTGVTLTRMGVVNALTAIVDDYMVRNAG